MGRRIDIVVVVVVVVVRVNQGKSRRRLDADYRFLMPFKTLLYQKLCFGSLIFLGFFFFLSTFLVYLFKENIKLSDIFPFII